MGKGFTTESTEAYPIGWEFFEQCESWYDLFGCCYMLLDEVFPDHSELIDVFCSPVVSGGRANPNLSKLLELEEMVARISAQHWNCPNERPDSEASSPLQDVVTRADELADNLQNYREDSLNTLTPWYFVARGIDRGASQQKPLCDDMPGEVKEGIRQVRAVNGMRVKRERQLPYGPLNGRFVEGDKRVGVYQKTAFNLVERISMANRLERLPSSYLNDQFNALMGYVPHDCHAPIPRMLLLPRPKRWNPPSESNPMKVGVVPFARSRVIGISGPGEPALVVPGDGNSFTVEYLDGYEEQFKGKVIGAIDEAISRGCHIVLFPELVMPVCLVEVVRRHLASLHGEHSLALVVAGSGWVVSERDGRRHDANVCHLIDGFGMLAGEHHKRKRFHLTIRKKEWPYYVEEPSTSGLSNAENAKDAITLVEGFTGTYSESTLVVVPDFGLVMPVVCMDLVSNDGFATSLANSFRPQLVCCPAMSSSLDRGFKLPCQQLAERFLSAVCICDLCGSRKGGSVPIGVASVPGFYSAECEAGVVDGSGDKGESVLNSSSDLASVSVSDCRTEAHIRSEKQPYFVIEEFSRTSGCESECSGSSDVGCLFVVEVDYSSISSKGIKPLINAKGPFTFSSTPK